MSAIPWKDFEEEEIQGILYQYFISLGYKVDWVHLIERPLEKKIGCDLLCTKDEKTMGIAVKKKPRSKDHEQFKKLSRKSYDQKLYFYVQTPSLSFMNQIKNYSSEVEMLRMREFEKKMEDTEVGLQILCFLCYSNSHFIDLATSFISELLKFTKNITKEELDKKVLKPMPELWQLKDYTVTMRKSTEILLSILEESIFYTETSPKVLFFIFKEILWMLAHNMNGFCQTWKKMLKKEKCLLSQTYHKYGNRSNWLGLWTFVRYLTQSGIYSPGILKNNLENLWKIDKSAHEKEQANFSALLKKKMGRIYVPRPLFAEFVTERFLRPHFGFALSLEGLIDQMFEL